MWKFAANLSLGGICGHVFLGGKVITEVKLAIAGLKLEALTAAMGSVSVFWVVIPIC
jgi:hypothetical protein